MAAEASWISKVLPVIAAHSRTAAGVKMSLFGPRRLIFSPRQSIRSWGRWAVSDPNSLAARPEGGNIGQLLLVGFLALGTTSGFSSSPGPETIQATYTQNGKVVGVTLIVYNYTTSADLQVLSLAFQDGQDRELATALSKTKAVGLCSIYRRSQL